MGSDPTAQHSAAAHEPHEAPSTDPTGTHPQMHASAAGPRDQVNLASRPSSAAPTAATPPRPSTSSSSRAPFKPRNPAYTPHRRPAPYDPTRTLYPTTPKPCSTRPHGPRELPAGTEHLWPRAGPPAGLAQAPSARWQTECTPADHNPGTGPGGNHNPHPADPAYLTSGHQLNLTQSDTIWHSSRNSNWYVCTRYQQL